MYSQKQTLDFILQSKPMLREKYYVSKIGLFGSYARQEQSVNSDIDLIVEFDEKTEKEFDAVETMRKIHRKRHEEYTLNPEPREKRLATIREKYAHRIKIL